MGSDVGKERSQRQAREQEDVFSIGIENEKRISC